MGSVRSIVWLCSIWSPEVDQRITRTSELPLHSPSCPKSSKPTYPRGAARCALRAGLGLGPLGGFVPIEDVARRHAAGDGHPGHSTTACDAQGTDNETSRRGGWRCGDAVMLGAECDGTDGRTGETALLVGFRVAILDFCWRVHVEIPGQGQQLLEAPLG